MTDSVYSPELIAWVQRTTTAQGLPEKVHPDLFTTRFAALFGVTGSSQPSRDE